MLTHSLSRSLCLFPIRLLFLSVMAADVSSSVAQQAIQAIGSIAVRVSSRANMCVDKLMTLLSMEIDHITSEVIVIMTSELEKKRLR